MLTEKLPKVATKYWCEHCDYNTDKTSSYSKHLLTAKHLRKRQITEKLPKVATPLICCDNCNKTYKSRVGLWKHKQMCKEIANEIDISNTIDPTMIPNPDTLPLPPQFDAALVIELLKQNQEFKEIMLEQSRQMAERENKLLDAVKDGKLGNTNNTNNTNCHNTTNNKFNLNVFLNETCKDAISMDDFIKSFEVTRDEFLHTAKVGYIEGLSAVMANRFKDMDVHTRPLHCTDLKRETVYIKNADKWEKDDADKTQMRKAVRGVARKNKQEMWRWYDDNKPEVEQIGTDVCEDYFKYHRSTLGGYGKEEDLKFEDKIIKNVLKGVLVDKSSALTI